MSDINEMLDIDKPFIESILHLTDFSDEGQSAFAHALAIAVFRKAWAENAYELMKQRYNEFTELKEGLLEKARSYVANFWPNLAT